MYKIVLLSVLAVAAASPTNLVYTTQGVNTPLVYSNGQQIVSTLGQAQLVNGQQYINGQLINGQTQLINGQAQLVNGVQYVNTLGQAQLINNNVPLTYTTNGIQTIQNPVVYTSGVQTIQNPVVVSTGAQTIQQSPVVLTRTAGVESIQTVPSVVSTGAKITNTYEPVEQHGYSISYKK